TLRGSRESAKEASSVEITDGRERVSGSTRLAYLLVAVLLTGCGVQSTADPSQVPARPEVAAATTDADSTVTPGAEPSPTGATEPSPAVEEDPPLSMGCSIDGTPEPALRPEDRVYDSPEELFAAFQAMPLGPKPADGALSTRDQLINEAHEDVLVEAELIEADAERARWHTVRDGELVGEWEAQNFGEGWGISYWWFRVPEEVCGSAPR
ncbi:MAG TPA: hypothetical protein VHG93_05755, partial [Longimicrobium sp.]|nr:hypothetical protein [Longimicrobium sp.]